MNGKTVNDHVRTIPDVLHEGVPFRYMTAPFDDPRGLRMAVDLLVHPVAGRRFGRVAGREGMGLSVHALTAFEGA